MFPPAGITWGKRPTEQTAATFRRRRGYFCCLLYYEMLVWLVGFVQVPGRERTRADDQSDRESPLMAGQHTEAEVGASSSK